MTHDTAIERLEHEAKRAKEIVGVLAKYHLAGWLRQIPLPWDRDYAESDETVQVDQLSHEERIRLALTELGTTYIKLGQMLSTRPDLVGADLARELSKLQSDTPPNPPEVVKELIHKEFGKDPSELYAHFEEKAFASASIAQVHRARLKTGEQVVVKVQKAGIQSHIEQDLAIMADLVSLAEKHVAEARVYNPVGLVEEFRRSLMNELDFTRERHNLDAFNRNFASDETVRFPGAYPELSTRLVLTMDFMDGILGTDAEAMRGSGCDLKEFSRRGATIYLDMIFRDSFYHADPHPGNLMLMAGDVVGIIDCGMVGRLDKALHEDFESLMLSVAQKDPGALTNALWKLSTEKPAGGISQLGADVSDLMAETTDVAVDEINMGAVIRGLAAVIHKYKISLRPALSQLLRTLVLLEGTAQGLDPKFSLAEVIEPYVNKLIIQKFAPDQILRRVVRNYRDWDRLIDTLPRDMGETLGQLQAGKFQVRIDLRHLDSIVNRLVLGIVLSALLLGSSFLWSLKARPLIDGVSVFGAAGYGIALVVGAVLVRSILRSGKFHPKE